MNAVVTGMDVLQDEEDEILVMLVEVDESQQNIEECVVDLSVTFTEARYFLVIDNAVSGGIVVNFDGAVNPDRELIDEVFLLLREWVVLVQVDDGFRGVFAEYSFALWGIVPLSTGTLTRFFFAASTPLAIAAVTSPALPRP